MFIGAPTANWFISAYGWRVSYMIVGSIILPATLLGAQFLRRPPSHLGQSSYDEGQDKKQHPTLAANGLSLRQAIYTRKFWVVSAVFLCFGFNQFTIILHIVPHAIELGVSPAIAANVLAGIGLTSIVSKVSMGYLVDRIGSKKSLAISLAIMLFAFSMLLLFKELWWLYAFSIAFAFAYGGGGS